MWEVEELTTNGRSEGGGGDGGGGGGDRRGLHLHVFFFLQEQEGTEGLLSDRMWIS